jgi:hypothetical protein
MDLEPAADGEDDPLQFGVRSIKSPGREPASGRRAPRVEPELPPLTYGYQVSIQWE